MHTHIRYGKGRAEHSAQCYCGQKLKSLSFFLCWLLKKRLSCPARMHVRSSAFLPESMSPARLVCKSAQLDMYAHACTCLSSLYCSNGQLIHMPHRSGVCGPFFAPPSNWGQECKSRSHILYYTPSNSIGSRQSECREGRKTRDLSFGQQCLSLIVKPMHAECSYFYFLYQQQICSYRHGIRHFFSPSMLRLFHQADLLDYMHA